jgi:hypothetical protein
VLEEDNASGHGGEPKARVNNLVAKWKKRHNVKTYFNCHNSPDLTIIETCWQPPKDYQRKRPYWDKQALNELLEEGWNKVDYEYINNLVKTMPRRLEDVKRLDGDMTYW